MTDEYVYKIWSRYLQKILKVPTVPSKIAEVWHKTCKKQALFGEGFLISGPHRDFPNIIFWPILTLQEVLWGHFSRSLRKFDLKTCIAALNPVFFTFFTWWPGMTLTCMYYGDKAQEMILTDVSDTIHADSLALFALNIDIYSPMTPSPKSRKFLLWPDLWRHQWPPGHFFTLFG